MTDMRRRTASRSLRIAAWLCLALVAGRPLLAQSIDIPSKTWGLSIGNSKEFTGLRFNFRDSRVRDIKGINVTLWMPRKDNKDAVITGLSLGIIPGGGHVRGVQLGLLGAAAETDLTGLNVAGVGVGAGEDLTGINIGGLGVGAGNDVKGLCIGGLGVGAGENVTGICLGGLGVGAGASFKGIAIGGLGAGAGDNITGLVVGGLGAGCGETLTGIAIGGLGVGAGEMIRGLVIGGLGGRSACDPGAGHRRDRRRRRGPPRRLPGRRHGPGREGGQAYGIGCQLLQSRPRDGQRSVDRHRQLCLDDRKRTPAGRGQYRPGQPQGPPRLAGFQHPVLALPAETPGPSLTTILRPASSPDPCCPAKADS